MNSIANTFLPCNAGEVKIKIDFMAIFTWNFNELSVARALRWLIYDSRLDLCGALCVNLLQ